MQHWIITVSLHGHSEDELESLGMELVSEGALGAYVAGPSEVRFFLKGDMDAVRITAESLLPHNATFTIAEAPDENWTQRCAEILTPLTVKNITVQPLVSAGSRPEGKSEKGTLFIIPGLGFGTGHHETTKNVIGILQSEDIASKLSTIRTPKVLDVGTGSGILAIAAQKLYDADVDAIDIDSDALANAAENASLNELTIPISFSETPLERCSGAYDLIIANIYAEVLITMEKAFFDRLSTGKPLILSGIMSSKEELIREHFSSKRWKIALHVSENNWSSFLLERIA